MSDPTYRIETSHEPSSHDDLDPWIARIIQLSDDTQAGAAWGDTEEKAAEKARRLIAAMQDETKIGRVYYTDDEGNLTHPPVEGHSVKA